MKKIICSFAFAATLIAVSAADATKYSSETSGSNSQISCPCPKELPLSQCVTWESLNCNVYEVKTEAQFKNTEEHIDKGETGGTTTTATVLSCPTGMTKSSDGCCCVNN